MAPFGIVLGAPKSMMSKPSMLRSAGLRVVTFCPLRSFELLKKLFPGDAAVASVVVLPPLVSVARSPVLPQVTLVGDHPELRLHRSGERGEEPRDRDRLRVAAADHVEAVEHGEVPQRQRRVAVDDDERPSGVAVLARAGGDVRTPPSTVAPACATEVTSANSWYAWSVPLGRTRPATRSVR